MIQLKRSQVSDMKIIVINTINSFLATVFQTLTSNKSAITRIDHCVVNSISNRRDLRCVLDCDEQVCLD